MLLSPWFKALLRGRNRRLRKQAARRKHQHHRNVASQMELLETRTMLSATSYLMVDATDPTDSDENEIAANATTVEMNFEKAVKNVTYDSDDFYVHGMQSGVIDNAITVSGSTISMNTSGEFFAGETVRVTLTDSVLATDDDSAHPYVWQFTTAVGSATPAEDTGDFTLYDDTDLFADTTKKENIQDIALGDFDGDGDLDAFGVKSYSHLNNSTVDGRHEVWENDGSGNFTDTGKSILGQTQKHFSHAAEVADFDGDGHLDVFVANARYGRDSDDDGMKNEVYLNNGNGDFTFTKLIVPGSYNSLDIAVGDLDNDGIMDVYVANAWYDEEDGENKDRILKGDGDGTFTLLDTIDNGDSSDVELADVDGDGYLDAIVGGPGGPAGSSSSVEIYINNGDGTFGTSADDSVSGVAHNYIDVGDLDGDGDIDIIGQSKGQTPQVLINEGDGTFYQKTNATPFTDSALYIDQGIELQDYDGDGDLDAMLAWSDGSGNAAQEIFFNDGLGNFHDIDHDFGGDGDFDATALAIGDLDGDGDLDAFFGVAEDNGTSQSAKIFKNGTRTVATPFLASFEDEANEDMSVVDGTWTREEIDRTFKYKAEAPTAGGWAISTVDMTYGALGDYSYSSGNHRDFDEISVEINMTNDDTKSNGYIIFDYNEDVGSGITEFKYAGLDQDNNRLVIGEHVWNSVTSEYDDAILVSLDRENDSVDTTDTPFNSINTLENYVMHLRFDYQNDEVQFNINQRVHSDDAAEDEEFLLTYNMGTASNYYNNDVGLGTFDATTYFDNFHVGRDLIRDDPFNAVFEDFDSANDVYDLEADTTYWSSGAALLGDTTGGNGFEVALRDTYNLTKKFDISVDLFMHDATGTDNENAYIVFDYVDQNDYKYVRVSNDSGKWELGHKVKVGSVTTDNIIDTYTGGTCVNRYMNVHIRIDGREVTVHADNNLLFQEVFDDIPYMNHQKIGLGVDNAKSAFDNFQVETEITYERSFDPIDEDFESYADGTDPDDWVGASGALSLWEIEDTGSDKVFQVDTSATHSVVRIDLGETSTDAKLPGKFDVAVEITPYTTGSNSDLSGMIVFDYQSETDFKYAGIYDDGTVPKWVIGHYDGTTWNHEKTYIPTVNISAGGSYDVKISIDKNKVSLYVEEDDFSPLLEHEFDCFLNNGEIGLTARKSKTQFDDFKIDLEIDML